MAEPTVAVSQIEDEVEYRVRTVVARVRMAEKHGEPYPSEWVNNQIGAGRERVRFLLSQPTPTAPVFCEQCGAGAESIEHYDRCVVNVAPPSIADMVPGTTFRARTRDGALSHAERFWMVTGSGWVISTEVHHIDGQRIDPSTIRDVQPPAVTT